MRQVATLERETSPTAASASNRLFGPSGVIRYRVILAQGGGATKGVVIDAATGDEAAEKAIATNSGWRVAYVGPAGDAPPSINTEVE